MEQNQIWIEADIPFVNLTPSRYNALTRAIGYVSNDFTIPAKFMTSQ